MHYLRILCGIRHFLWCSTLLKIISAFFTAASVRLITVQTFQAISFYVSNKGLPRINLRDFWWKVRFSYQLPSICLCIRGRIWYFNRSRSGPYSTHNFNQGFSESQTKINLILLILVMAKNAKPWWRWLH